LIKTEEIVLAIERLLFLAELTLWKKKNLLQQYEKRN